MQYIDESDVQAAAEEQRERIRVEFREGVARGGDAQRAALEGQPYLSLTGSAVAAIAAHAEQFRHDEEPDPVSNPEGFVRWRRRRVFSPGIVGQINAGPPADQEREDRERRRRLFGAERHYYHPVTGAYVGIASTFPPEYSPAWYVEIHDDWTALDLAGVRVARQRPTLYGVHDDGLCACHPGPVAA